MASDPGIYVGKLGRKFLKLPATDNVLVSAPTGTGKTSGLAVPNALGWPGSLVALDMKRELYAKTAGHRAALGHRVFLFDPLSETGRTHRYNPFSYVRVGTIHAISDIMQIATLLYPATDPGTNSAYFQDSGSSAFMGGAAFIAETPGLPLTIGEVLRLFCRADGPAYLQGMMRARQEAGRPYTKACVSALNNFMMGSTEQVNAVRSSVTAPLGRLWFNPQVDAATAESDFDLRKLRHEPMAIYVGASAGTIDQLRPLLRLFWQQLIYENVRTMPDDDGSQHKVLCLLDEFANTGHMPVLASAISFVRGYWLRMMFFTQTRAQLDIYGSSGAETIVDNCGLEVVFGIKNQKAAEELSRRIGTNTEKRRTVSGPRFWSGWHRQQQSVSEHGRPLLLPQELVRLPDTEQILIRSGMSPVKCTKIRYFREEHFMQLLQEPPEVPVIDVPIPMDDAEIEKPKHEPPTRKPTRKRSAN